MKDSKESWEQKKWEHALKLHEIYSQQVRSSRNLVSLGMKSASVYEVRAAALMAKIEEEYPQLKGVVYE